MQVVHFCTQTPEFPCICNYDLQLHMCNAPATLIGYLPNHGRCAWDPDCPHIPTLVFSAHFVLTRAHPGSTSRSVTHPKTTPGQARLTWEFFPDGLPEKKVHLVDMSSLSFLLRSWAVTAGYGSSRTGDSCDHGVTAGLEPSEE